MNHHILQRAQRAIQKLAFFFLVSIGVFAVPADADEVSKGEKLFALRIQPLFAQKCLACHGQIEGEIDAEFDMRTRESIVKGGINFGNKVVITGSGEQSLLYIVTTRKKLDYEMPPKEADQLTEQQQWWIRDWIDEGAPWPDETRVRKIQNEYAQGEQVSVSKALSDQWQNRRYDPDKLWAYRPLKVTEVPDDVHPIDWFLNRKLASEELAPAPSATAQVIYRRLSFGLTGLPPRPHQVHQFKQDYDKDPEQAIREASNRLLESPHYGEHFGWRWLDVVRYADTAGFANDYSRPNAWRYRDYVVRSFNQDRPFHEFTRQQIAGDELDPSQPENLIATGFLRMGPWEQTGMSVFKETRGQWLDDVTDTVGQAFLGHSMLCCKCHDHKFDPVPTRDFYRLQAVFSTTQFGDRTAAFLPTENKQGFQESNGWVDSKINAYQSQQQALLDKMDANRKQETGDTKVGDNGLDPGDEASLARMKKNIIRHKIEKDRTKPIAFSVYTGATIFKKNIMGRIHLPKNRWNSGQMDIDAIRVGGNVHAIGDPVRPGSLSAAESLGQMDSFDFPTGKGNRRTALADWIVSPSNPLTARVIVNRIWSWHFGKGIAANPNNVGGTGGLPTHPDLLDYLAKRFMKEGWSIKKLNRLIVTSQAYRRSSRHPDEQRLAEKDPSSQLYAKFQPRRLTAEELRDAMLFTSGELNLKVGGIPCRPDINLEVAFQPRQIMGGAASVYEPDPYPEQRNRRTLYAERIRGLRDPFLETFNQPGADKSCELRETSTVAPQALTLINSQEIFDRSLAFANRLVQEKLPNQKRVIQRAFQLALGRGPTMKESKICLQHWNDSLKDEKQKSYPSQQVSEYLTRTVMAEKTGRPYTFEEYMPAFAQYQPDLQPGDVDANTRALARVCRVLLNTNEFSYLD
ncbi:MAG: PSD1 and planctomycete cytochrome C domain-containing protein [Planctomycetota bacterium]